MTRAQRRAFLRDQSGATAVEFGLVALPFFFIMFAILEIGLVFVVDTVLENAVIDTGRLIRTGQASASAMDKTRFIDTMCAEMSVFAGDCKDRVSVDVRVIPQFASSAPDPISGGAFHDDQTAYSNGNPGDLMLVRVWYRHPLMTSFLSDALSKLDDGNALLLATTAFRNEPA